MATIQELLQRKQELLQQQRDALISQKQVNEVPIEQITLPTAPTTGQGSTLALPTAEEVGPAPKAPERAPFLERAGEAGLAEVEKQNAEAQEIIRKIKSNEVFPPIGFVQLLGKAARIGTSPITASAQALTPITEEFATQISNQTSDETKAQLAEGVKFVTENFQAFNEKLPPELQDTFSGIADTVIGLTRIAELAPVGLGVKQTLKTGEKGVEILKEAGEVVGDAKKLSKEKSFLQGLAETEKPQTALQKQANQSAGNLNRILQKKAQEFEKMTGGKSHGQWLNERGINNTVDKNIETLGDKFLKEKSVLDEGISEIPGTHKPSSLMPVLDESIELARLEERTGDLNLLEGIKTKFEIGGGVSAEDIIKVKRVYEKNNKFTYSKGTDSVSASKLVRATQRDAKLREDLINIAEDAGFKEFRDLSKEIQQTRFVMDEIGIAHAKARSKPIFNISDRILGGASIAEPSLALGVIASKTLSSEKVRSLFQKAFAAQPKKPITISLPKIKQKAKQLLEKEKGIKKGIKKETAKQKKFAKEQAIIADELKKKGVVLGEGFQIVKDQPITRQEQMMIRATANADEAEQMARFIIEERAKGNAVGEGFVVKNIDETSISKGATTKQVESIKDVKKKIETFDLTADEAKGVSEVYRKVGLDTLADKVDNYAKSIDNISAQATKQLQTEISNDLNVLAKQLSAKLSKIKGIDGLDLPATIKELDGRAVNPKILEELKLLDDSFDEFKRGNPEYSDMTVDEFFSIARGK